MNRKEAIKLLSGVYSGLSPKKDPDGKLIDRGFTLARKGAFGNQRMRIPLAKIVEKPIFYYWMYSEIRPMIFGWPEERMKEVKEYILGLNKSQVESLQFEVKKFIEQQKSKNEKP